MVPPSVLVQVLLPQLNAEILTALVFGLTLDMDPLFADIINYLVWEVLQKLVLMLFNAQHVLVPDNDVFEMWQ